MMKRNVFQKLEDWIFGIIFGLLMVLALKVFLHISDWFSGLIWGKDVGKVANIVNILCILISVAFTWVFVLGPRIRGRK